MRLKDVEAIQRLLSSPQVFAIFDLPWTPIFLLAIFAFHPWLGWFALSGAALMLTISLSGQWMTRRPNEAAFRSAAESERLAGELQSLGETVAGLGMQEAALARWSDKRQAALQAQIATADRTGTFGSASKAMRFLLQSAILALGAYLVLEGQVTPGIMIASSILLGRALAPVDQAISGWPLFLRARSGWNSLKEFLATAPIAKPPTVLPRPEARLETDRLTIVPPGQRSPTLKLVSFSLQPGTAMGVIGASGSGKTTLARALTGMWPAASGRITLGGAALDQYSRADLGRYIGYLPQDVDLFGMTVAENIARMATERDDAEIVRAARAAGAHDIIVDLPKGYDTPLEAGGNLLSGGQRQRIGLARALYGNPEILILDEPNAHLDSDGQSALNTAIREMKADGKAVIIMAHRPAAIAECNNILVLENGAVKAIGPRDEVLKAQVKNYAQLSATLRQGAG